MNFATALGSILTLLMLAAPPVASADRGSVDAAFYQPPSSAAPGPHGSIIRSRELHGSPGLPGARNFLVLYRSVDIHGRAVPVSGTVSLPAGRPPAGGWPLISWAHGTTGVADICAPSRDTGPAYPAHDYTSLVDKTLARWVAAGYAVAQTDYQGLGTPGAHGYLIGEAEERAVADIALAARQLAPEIGRRWLAIGHSQGGQAAVFTDALAQQWAPQLDLLGAVALAPGTHVNLSLDLAPFLPAAGASIAFTPLIIDGANTVRDLDLPRLLTPRALALMPLADTECIGQLRESPWTQLPMNQLYRPGADLAPLRGILNANDPSHLRFSRPLLVLQGNADQTVSPAATDAMVAQLTVDGQPVQYHRYPGVDHRGLPAASFPEVLAWADARFGRGQPG